MIVTVAGVFVLLAGVYLVALGVLAIVNPAAVARFLHGHASSVRMHALELLLRVLVGSAFALYAPRMLWPGLFNAFGWILIVTTAGLAMIPWRWHRRVADRTVPTAVRHLTLLGVAAVAAGVLVCWAVAAGTAGDHLRNSAGVRAGPSPDSPLVGLLWKTQGSEVRCHGECLASVPRSAPRHRGLVLTRSS